MAKKRISETISGSSDSRSRDDSQRSIRSDRHQSSSAQGSGSGPQAMLGSGNLIDKLQAAWPAAVVAAIVATWMLPCDSVSVQLGDGLPLALIWIGVAMWGAMVWTFRPPARSVTRQLQPWLIAWIVVLALCALSTYTQLGRGNARWSINSFWQWAASAMASLSIAAVAVNPRWRRAIVCLMLMLSAAAALHGMYQYLISMPADRLAFATDPVRFMRQAGQEATPGSPAYQLFVNRLESTEPFGPFALANSLAAVLTAWVIVAVGIGIRSFGSERAQRELFAIGVAVTLSFLVLVLTKSRAAWIGCAVGLGWLGLNLIWLGSSLLKKRFAWTVMGLAIFVVPVAIYGLMRDPQVLTEATKSFEYRIEYWKATSELIRDYPFLGIGPGNFQSYYTHYKLPQASEAVADPHNWILETAALIGVPGLLAVIGMIVVSLFGLPPWRIRRSSSWRSDSEVAEDLETRAEVENEFPVKTLVAGCIAGLMLGFLAGLPVGYFPEMLPTLGGVIVAGAIGWGGMSWIRRGELPRWIIEAAVVGFLTSLLAAGGWMSPGVGLSLSVLLGASLGGRVSARYVEQIAEEGKSSQRLKPSMKLGGLALATTLMGVAFLVTAWQPVLALRGKGANLLGLVSVAELQSMSELDRFDPQPRQLVARRVVEDFLQGNGDWPRVEGSIRSWVLANPANARTRRQAGDWCWSVALLPQGGIDATPMQAAIDYYSDAILRYPNDAGMWLQRAAAFEASGQRVKAQSDFRRAMELDRAHMHLDRKLNVQETWWPQFPGAVSTGVGSTGVASTGGATLPGASGTLGMIPSQQVVEYFSKL